MHPTEILRNPVHNTSPTVHAKVELIPGHGRDSSRSQDNIRTAALMTAAASATAQSSGTPQEQQEAARLALLSMLGRKGSTPTPSLTTTTASAASAATSASASVSTSAQVSVPTVSKESGPETGQTKGMNPQSKGALDGNKLMNLLSASVTQPTVSTVSSAGSEGKRQDAGDLSALLKGQLNISGNNTVKTTNITALTPTIDPLPVAVPVSVPVPLVPTVQDPSDTGLNSIYFPMLSSLPLQMMNPTTAMRTRREAVAKAQLEEMERKENASKESAPEVLI